MSKQPEQGTGQKVPRQPSKDQHAVTGQILSDRPKRAKPTGGITYTIEKGANVWPWQKKA